MRLFATIFALCLLGALGLHADTGLVPIDDLEAEEDLIQSLDDLDADTKVDAFKSWSWKGGESNASPDAARSDTPAPVAPTTRISPSADRVSDLEEPDDPLLNPTPPPAQRVPADSTTARLRRLVNENMDLVEQREGLSKDLEGMRRENATLKARVADIETSRQEMAGIMKNLQAGADATAQREQALKTMQAQLVELQASKRQLEAEKSRLESELVSVRVRQDRLENDFQEGAAVGGSAGPKGPEVRADSDLYKSLKQEKDALERETRALEDELARVKKALAADQSDRVAQATSELRAQLKEEQAMRKRERRVMGKVVKDAMDQKSELEHVRGTLVMRTRELKQKENELRSIVEELQRRDFRLDQAERTVARIDEAHIEVQALRSRETADMHYNMGVMNLEQEDVAAARLSFLNALRLDPDDADVHYNLGVIYESHLDEPKKAFMHYKQYLRLNPEAADASLVKQWLFELEMKIR